jgi:hypothetical protein
VLNKFPRVHGQWWATFFSGFLFWLGSEITFTSKGKQVSRTPPLIADVEKELNIEKQKKTGICYSM